MRYVYGIDPGLKGGVTLIDTSTGSTWCWATPIIKGSVAKKGPRGGKIPAIKDEYDPVRMASLIGASKDSSVWIERVGAMPGQGVTSMFRFGYGAGLWHGIVGARELVPNLVQPQTWKKKFELTDDKNLSREIASKIAPNCSGFWPLVKHDGIAESFLIAVYGIHELGLSILEFRVDLEPV